MTGVEAALSTGRVRGSALDGVNRFLGIPYAEDPVGDLRFAAPDSPESLAAGFAELRTAVAAVTGSRDTDTLTEVLWATLHGLVTLGRGDRLSPGRDAERVELAVAQLVAEPA